MIDEIIKSIKAHLYDRATSPLMGSFIISWIIWNYKFIFLIFSSLPILEKLPYVANNFFIDWTDVVLNGLIGPGIVSLAYIYIYPIPAQKVYEHSRNKQKEISDIKRKIEDETLLSVKESLQIRGEIYQLEEEYQRDIERKNTEIKKLKNEIISFNEIKAKKSLSAKDILNQDDDKHTPISIKLDNKQVDQLEVIGRFRDQVNESNLLKGNYVESKFNLGELENRDYIKRDYDQEVEAYVYSLTHKGRTYLVKNKHI